MFLIPVPTSTDKSLADIYNTAFEKHEDLDRVQTKAS